MANEYWKININDFNGGLAPAWFESEYPSYGNKNMSGDMKDISLVNPHSLSQGLSYTKIDETISNNLTSVIGRLVASDTTYGGGGDTIYEITSSSIDNIHTISGTSPIVEDVIDYNGDLYYSYNDGSDGYIGKYDYDSTWNDTWQGPFGNDPHPMLVAGDNKIYKIDRIVLWFASLAGSPDYPLCLFSDTFSIFLIGHREKTISSVVLVIPW